ncbi:CPCC family cysteine-rich protein [Limnobaculum zhutongyuii]|uniref:CPCC family cysteine-rich protein n=1 Tax=Limnobaculum zhutongyuii TaxID=2498113 RepID=UPI001FEBEA03
MISDELYSCPCCGAKVIDELGCYEICPVCDWENDPVQSSDPEYAGGANEMSLNSAKKIYNKLK